MASYAFRTFDERKQIENLWEAGAPAKEIADKLNISISAFYTELRRGQDGTRLPNQRRRCDADLAQLRPLMAENLRKMAKSPQPIKKLV